MRVSMYVCTCMCVHVGLCVCICVCGPRDRPVTTGCHLQDAAADQKFALSALRDVALLTCRSRAAELARQTEEEERAFAAAVEQDQEELKAIEARIRDIRKETAAERRSLQDFQVRSTCISFAHNPPLPFAPWLRVLIPSSPRHPRLSPGALARL